MKEKRCPCGTCYYDDRNLFTVREKPQMDGQMHFHLMHRGMSGNEWQLPLTPDDLNDVNIPKSKNSAV